MKVVIAEKSLAVGMSDGIVEMMIFMSPKEVRTMAMTLQQARTNVKTASGLDILGGLWLIIAPFVLGYATINAALWNDVLAGVAIAALATSREVGEGYKHAWPSWVNALIGVWLLFAPFVLEYAGVLNAVRNDVIMGILVAVVATWSALATPRPAERAGM